MKLTGFQI